MTRSRYGSAERHFTRAEACARRDGNATAAKHARKEVQKMQRVIGKSKQREKKLAAKMVGGL